MGCPSSTVLGDNLVFSVVTHDPDNGTLTDADFLPTYRIYEDETPAPIKTGTMAKLDDVNTTGFYTELIACTTGNGFSAGKTYTVYIEATVVAFKGGITYGFKVAQVALTGNDVADAYLDRANAVDGFTPREVQRLELAVLAGKSSGGPDNTVFLAADDSKPRVTSQTTSNGDRLVVVKDAS